MSWKKVSRRAPCGIRRNWIWNAFKSAWGRWCSWSLPWLTTHWILRLYRVKVAISCHASLHPVESETTYLIGEAIYCCSVVCPFSAIILKTLDVLYLNILNLHHDWVQNFEFSTVLKNSDFGHLLDLTHMPQRRLKSKLFRSHSPFLVVLVNWWNSSSNSALYTFALLVSDLSLFLKEQVFLFFYLLSCMKRRDIHRLWNSFLAIEDLNRLFWGSCNSILIANFQEFHLLWGDLCFLS